MLPSPVSLTFFAITSLPAYLNEVDVDAVPDHLEASVVGRIDDDVVGGAELRVLDPADRVGVLDRRGRPPPVRVRVGYPHFEDDAPPPVGATVGGSTRTRQGSVRGLEARVVDHVIERDAGRGEELAEGELVLPRKLVNLRRRRSRSFARVEQEERGRRCERLDTGERPEGWPAGGCERAARKPRMPARRRMQPKDVQGENKRLHAAARLIEVRNVGVIQLADGKRDQGREEARRVEGGLHAVVPRREGLEDLPGLTHQLAGVTRRIGLVEAPLGIVRGQGLGVCRARAVKHPQVQLLGLGEEEGFQLVARPHARRGCRDRLGTWTRQNVVAEAFAPRCAKRQGGGACREVEAIREALLVPEVRGGSTKKSTR